MELSPSPEALVLGERFRLALHHRVRSSHVGERLGPGTGSSTEFHDSRAYQPGDDVRHVDWRALARTGHVMVRQYREETLPRLELLLDTSRSMAVDEAKARLALDLAAVLAGAGLAEGFELTLHRLADERPAPERAPDLARWAARPTAFAARRPLRELLAEVKLRAGSLRVLVSDCLDPAGPARIVSPLERGAGGWALLQVLATADVDPPRDRALRLLDAERDEALDLELDPGRRERYLERLRRLVGELSDTSRSRGGVHLELVADRSLEEHCRGALVENGVLLPA